MEKQKSNVLTLVLIVIVGTTVGAIGWFYYQRYQTPVNEIESNTSETAILPEASVRETPVSPTITNTASPFETKPLADFNELTSSSPRESSQIVVGYIWHSYKGSANFSSVVLPAWGMLSDKEFMNREYTIDIWDGKDFVFYSRSVPLKEIVFPEGGVYKFRVMGISSDYAICPGDRSQATWGVKFVSNGVFNGERTPIVSDLSEEGKTCKILH